MYCSKFTQFCDKCQIYLRDFLLKKIKIPLHKHSIILILPV